MNEYRVGVNPQFKEEFEAYIAAHSHEITLLDGEDVRKTSSLPPELETQWKHELEKARSLVDRMKTLTDKEQIIAREMGILDCIKDAFRLREKISTQNMAIQDTSFINNLIKKMLDRSVENDEPTSFSPLRGKLGMTWKRRGGFGCGFLDPRGVIILIQHYGLAGDVPISLGIIARENQYRFPVTAAQLSLAHDEIRRNSEIQHKVTHIPILHLNERIRH